MDFQPIAIEAARAMDIGDYVTVQSLYDRLVDEGYEARIIHDAFSAEGANPDNIPVAVAGGCYMLKATRDPRA